MVGQFRELWQHAELFCSFSNSLCSALWDGRMGGPGGLAGGRAGRFGVCVRPIRKFPELVPSLISLGINYWKLYWCGYWKRYWCGFARAPGAPPFRFGRAPHPQHLRTWSHSGSTDPSSKARNRKFGKTKKVTFLFSGTGSIASPGK